MVKKIVIVIALLMPLTAFIVQFRSHSISEDPDDWASFGSYIGGVYSVIVTILVFYLTRALTKKDEKSKAVVEAVKQLYDQINKICNNGINLNSVNKLYCDADKYYLYLSDNTYQQILTIADYFQEVNSGKRMRDFALEKNILENLKIIYEQHI